MKHATETPMGVLTANLKESVFSHVLFLSRRGGARAEESYTPPSFIDTLLLKEIFSCRGLGRIKCAPPPTPQHCAFSAKRANGVASVTSWSRRAMRECWSPSLVRPALLQSEVGTKDFRVRKKGVICKRGSFHRSPFSRDSREFRDSRETPDSGK